jgi:hypothetical protein
VIINLTISNLNGQNMEMLLSPLPLNSTLEYDIRKIQANMAWHLFEVLYKSAKQMQLSNLDRNIHIITHFIGDITALTKNSSKVLTYHYKIITYQI